MATELKTIPRIFITPMRYEDIDAVMRVERHCFATPWSENAYRTELSNQCAEYYVAWLHGDLVGYIGMWLIMDEVHITTVGVSPDHRGNKVGERLLMRVLDASREKGAQRITLEVRKSNQAAINLYKKYLFNEVAVRKGYYSDNQEDALIMWVDDLWDGTFSNRFQALKSQLSVLEEG